MAIDDRSSNQKQTAVGKRGQRPHGCASLRSARHLVVGFDTTMSGAEGDAAGAEGGGVGIEGAGRWSAGASGPETRSAAL